MKKRVLSLLLMALLVCTMVLTGCGNDNGQTQSPGAGTAIPGADGGTPQVQRDEITIDAFMMAGVSSISGVWSDWCSYKLLEDLNVRINFWPTGSDVETKMRSYIAADNMPDLANFNNKSIAQEAVDAGLLIKLNEYAATMPNIFDTEMYDSAVRYYSDYISDGTGENIYVVPAGVGPPAYNSFNWVPQLQWAAYRDAGMPEISTLEDYLAAFEAMLAVKPTNERGEKVYALSLQPAANSISAMAYFYGKAVLDNLMEVDTSGDYAIKALTDEDSFFKRALKFVYEANQRGMLDPDSLTQSFDDITGKISDGRVLFSYYSWWTGTYNSDDRGNNTENPDGLMAVVADDFKLYEIPESTIGGARSFAISSHSKHIDRTAEVLNWMYSIDTHQYFHTGPEGLLWVMGEDGPEFTETGYEVVNGADMPMPGGGTLAQARALFNTLGQTDGVINPYTGASLGYWHWKSYLNRNPTLVKQEVASFYGTGTHVLEEYLVANDMVGKSTQAVNMLPAISKELELTATSIKEVLNTDAWKIVLAKDDEDFESLWKAMVDTCNGIGMDKVKAFYQQAWSEALAMAEEYK